MKKILVFILTSMTLISCHKDSEQCGDFLSDTNYTDDSSHQRYYYNQDGTLSLIYDFFTRTSYQFYYENKRSIRIEIPTFSPEKVFYNYDVQGRLSSTCYKHYSTVPGEVATDSITFEYDAEDRITRRNHFGVGSIGVFFGSYAVMEYSGKNPIKITHYKAQDYSGPELYNILT